MENYGKKITDLVKNSIGAFKTEIGSMDQKIKNLQIEYRVLGKDARMKKWIKYGGHCYYFSTDKTNWWKAQDYCKQFGGYLIKLDSNGGKTLILSSINIGISYWIGLTDMKKEGDFRWTHDQSKAVSLDWYPGYGSRGRRFNCGAVDCTYGRPQPFDQICSSNSYRYICESNVC